MTDLAKCPHCGSTELLALSDAWVVRSITGIDGDGDPIIESDYDVREFDDTHFECGGCGESLDWSAVETEEATEQDDEAGDMEKAD